MENKKIPAIRFKGFTEAWEQRKVGELASVSMNRRIFKEQTTENGDVPFFKIGTFGSTPDAYITRKLFEEYRVKYAYPKVGDILISASGSIGRTVEYSGKDEYFQDSNIVWLNHDERINNSFLKYFYAVVKWAGIEGSTIKRLYNDNILNTEICLPCAEEQQKIGTYFARLDNLITLHQRKSDKLVSVKKAMLGKMFPKDRNNFPDIRFKGFTEVWEQRKLGDLATVRTGYPFDSSEFDDNGEYLVITNGNIQNDSPTVNNTLGNRINVYSTKYSEYLLDKNDILVTMDGTVGRTAKVVEKKQILAQRVGRLTVKFDKEFLYQYLNTGEFFKEMGLVSHGGTIKHISLSEISQYVSYMPSSVEEQEVIGTYFSNLDTLITLHLRKAEKLKNIKKSLLEKMFI